MPSTNTTIPAGQWVLVTGATGFVASNVVQQFLNRGYKVRGTVRDLKSAQWLLDADRFKTQHESGAFEIVEVPNMSVDGAYDAAIKDVSAIAHVATISTLDPDPNAVIPQTVAGATNILEAALKEKSVQRIVFTSSSAASTLLVVGDKTHVGSETWNDAATEMAWAPPPYTPERSFITYAASKTAAEKAVWKFVEERKPHFTVNVVSPAGIVGQAFHEKHVESPANWVRLIYTGELPMLNVMPAGYFIDVKDVAVLHVAGILDPGVRSARLQSWGLAHNWNDFLNILRRLRPGKAFIDNWAEDLVPTVTTDQSDAVALLKKWGRPEGYRGLESSIIDTIDNKWFKYD